MYFLMSCNMNNTVLPVKKVNATVIYPKFNCALKSNFQFTEDIRCRRITLLYHKDIFRQIKKVRCLMRELAWFLQKASIIEKK